jgi:hypothetical protein
MGDVKYVAEFVEERNIVRALGAAGAGPAVNEDLEGVGGHANSVGGLVGEERVAKEPSPNPSPKREGNVKCSLTRWGESI